MNNMLVYVLSCVCPSIWCGKNFNIGHYVQTFQPNFYAPLTSTILYHFNLDLAGGPKSAEIKTCKLHFLTQFLSDQDEIVGGV